MAAAIRQAFRPSARLGRRSLPAALVAALFIAATAPVAARDFLLGIHSSFDSAAILAANGGDAGAAMRAEVDRTASLGAEAVRIPVDWRQLQPQQGAPRASFDTNYLSLVLAALGEARAKGIKAIVMLAQSPCWAVPAGLDCDAPEAIWHPPVEPGTYAAAFAHLAGEIVGAGLGPTVIGWEVWNEPNSITFWPTGHVRAGYNVLVGPSAADGYVALLNAAYDALKAVDPHISVLGGSLAAADVSYLERMQALGARYDALAIHPYAKANPARDGRAYGPDDCGAGSDALAPPWCFKGGVETLRAAMLRHHDERPVWFTEFGWSSSAEWGGAGSEAAQADNLARALDLIDGWDFVPVAILYELVDDGEGMGLLREDLSKKPAAKAFSVRQED